MMNTPDNIALLSYWYEDFEDTAEWYVANVADMPVRYLPPVVPRKVLGCYAKTHGYFPLVAHASDDDLLPFFQRFTQQPQHDLLRRRFPLRWLRDQATRHALMEWVTASNEVGQPALPNDVKQRWYGHASQFLHDEGIALHASNQTYRALCVAVNGTDIYVDSAHNFGHNWYAHLQRVSVAAFDDEDVAWDWVAPLTHNGCACEFDADESPSTMVAALIQIERERWSTPPIPFGRINDPREDMIALLMCWLADDSDERYRNATLAARILLSATHSNHDLFRAVVDAGVLAELVQTLLDDPFYAPAVAGVFQPADLNDDEAAVLTSFADDQVYIQIGYATALAFCQQIVELGYGTGWATWRSLATAGFLNYLRDAGKDDILNALTPP